MDKKKGKLKWIMLHHTKLRRTMLRRSLGILLAFAMVFGTLPINGITVSASENREAGLCKHHEKHTAECGYSEEDNTLCGYECHICPIEDLIAVLPEQMTEDNGAEVRAQLDEILALFSALNEDEQEQIDLSRCYELKEALDNANAPMTADGRTEQQDNDEASVTIGEETLYYATLEEAFAAANGQIATITMLADAECIKDSSPGSPLNINGGTVTLNLNGKTLSGKGYGNYGIIDVKGGSLLVEGEGNISVSGSGLTCHGGTLTVNNITLVLVTGTFYPNSGVCNYGGTVILNSVQMTGAASDGQIYQYSGATTVNNVTATGATVDCPISVWYYNEGTLKINGGTFDKIVVDSENYGGVQSVAELLGEGCAYKHQDGSWATADELAALEISNVTVEEIPLTIDPQGDTSWYYSTQQTHTLAMNAAPVDSGNSVSYVWKSGTETLDCTSDACTVSAGMSVGSYIYTCEATCDGYTLSHTFTFKIEKSGTEFIGGIKTYNGETETDSFTASDTITVKATPTATGEAPQKAAARLRGGPDAGQMALYVGDTLVSSEAADADADGTYTMTISASDVLTFGGVEPNGSAITLTAKFVGNDNMADAVGTVDVNISATAKAERDGTVLGYYDAGNLSNAFTEENSGATVTLLDNITIKTKITPATSNSNFILDLNGKSYTYDASNDTVFLISAFCSLTIKGNGRVTSPTYYGIHVDGGTLNIESGSFSAKDSAVYVAGDGTLQFTGGSFTGGVNAIYYESGEVKDALKNYSGADAPHYAFYQGSSPYAPSGSSLPSGTFTVGTCEHDGVKPTSNGNGTHSLTCPYCGYSEDAVDCAYVFSGTTGTCATCGDSVTVAVSGTDNLIYDGTGKEPEVTVTRDGTELAAGTNYTVAYSDNKNAGENKATVTVTIGNGQGTYTENFSIGRATPSITWVSTLQELTYSGNPAVITAPTVMLANNENFEGAISYSYKKQGETAYKDGLPTDAGTYTVKAHVDAESNYTAADSTNELELTIDKADAEIMVETATYNKNYGDPAFIISGVTDTNLEEAVQYAVTEGSDVVSISNGTVTIKNVGKATITVSLPATANYNAAEDKTITVNVAKKGGYIAEKVNKKHYYDKENAAGINLVALLPKDCGTITYGTPSVSGNVTYSVEPAVNDGKLSYILNKGNAGDAGAVTVTVTTQNYEDITVTVNIMLTKLLPVELKEGTEVTLADSTLTYGESLSKLEFNKAVFVNDEGNPVEGSLAWKDASETPDAGTKNAIWVFTPSNNAYMDVEGIAVVTVDKAVPGMSGIPTVAGKVYHPSVTLKDDELSATSVTVTGVNGTSLEGKWGWQDRDIVPAVGNSGYAAVFTPTDVANYKTVTKMITVDVTKAVPYLSVLPTAAGLTYGETLKDSSLSGGTVLYGDGTGQAGNGTSSTENVVGTFTWKDPSTKPVAADSNKTEYTIVFTPSDTANYSSVETKVTLAVKKAQNAPNMPGSTMNVSYSMKKAGSVPLPEGWEWQAADKEKALEVGVSVEAVAVYTGADKGNYENETVTVTITRSACNHVAGSILYTGGGEKAPTCTEDGLGHRECTKCGELVESGIVVNALGHTGGTADCSHRAVCTRCNQSYGGTDSSKHGDTEIRGISEATCTAGGYTGDTYCKECGAKTKTGNATPALGHDWHITSEEAATTTSEGKRVYTCSRCSQTREENIPKLPQPSHTHSYDTDWKSDSNSHWHECTCGDRSGVSAHTEDGGTVTKPATETETGIITYKCSVCGYVMRKEEIGKLPPAPTETPEQTEKPMPTGTPEQTEKPMPTGTPEQTKKPISTETPAKPTKKPQETITPEKVRENSAKLDSGISVKWKENTFALKWRKIAGAKGYDIFSAPCGEKLNKKSPAKTVKNGKTSVSLTKIASKKISGKKVYHVKIKAWKYLNSKKIYIGSSRTYHIAGKENKKYTNAKKLKPAKKKYVLKKGKSVRIQVTIVKQSKKKKLLPASHGPALQYWSDNEKIATVTQEGKVKAKKKGTCYIYVTALNGVKTKIKITVK